MLLNEEIGRINLQQTSVMLGNTVPNILSSGLPKIGDAIWLDDPNLRRMGELIKATDAKRVSTETPEIEDKGGRWTAITFAIRSLTNNHDIRDHPAITVLRDTRAV